MDVNFMKSLIMNEDNYEDIKMVCEIVNKAMNNVASNESYNHAVDAVKNALETQMYERVLTEEEYSSLSKTFVHKKIFNKGIYHTTNYLSVMRFEQELMYTPVIGKDFITVTPSTRIVDTRGLCQGFLKSTTLSDVVKMKLNSAIITFKHYSKRTSHENALAYAKAILRDLLEHPELTQDLKIAIVKRFEENL